MELESGLRADTPDQLQKMLQAEFDAVNREHFDGTLTTPELFVSTRKTYGGYYQPRRHRIVVSWQAHCEHGWGETRNTLRHEIAHIIHFDHSAAFWRLAIQLGATQRYASKPLTAPRTSHRYVYICPGCQRRVYRHRRLRRSSCGVCDKTFNPRFLLHLMHDGH